MAYWTVGIADDDNKMYAIQSEVSAEKAKEGAERWAKEMGYTVDWTKRIGVGVVPGKGVRFDVYRITKVQ